jgi:hypothetical protein
MANDANLEVRASIVELWVGLPFVIGDSLFGLRTSVVSRGLLGHNGAGPKLVWPTEGKRKNAKWRRNDEVRMTSRGNGERRVSKCGGAEATPHRNEWPLPDDPHPASGRPLPFPRARDCGPVPGRGGESAQAESDHHLP